MHRLTRIRWRPWTDRQIRWFIRRYRVDMGEAARGEIRDYEHFNAFFTRALRPGARPLAVGEGVISSPADGFLTSFGPVRGGLPVAIKGREYTVPALMGGDPDRARSFLEGSAATVYLSPRDYHRVHMPIAGELREMRYLPGALLSVSPATVARVPDLLARNERVSSVFDTVHGPLAVVMVGAVFVGGIEHVWCGPVAPRGPAIPRTLTYGPEGAAPVHLERGEEMGRFNMGSTVVMLLAGRKIQWREDLVPGMPVRQGETLGRVILEQESGVPL